MLTALLAGWSMARRVPFAVYAYTVLGVGLMALMVAAVHVEREHGRVSERTHQLDSLISVHRAIIAQSETVYVNTSVKAAAAKVRVRTVVDSIRAVVTDTAIVRVVETIVRVDSVALAASEDKVTAALIRGDAYRVDRDLWKARAETQRPVVVAPPAHVWRHRLEHVAFAAITTAFIVREVRR